jgi:acetyl-CoA carboxylase carboxyltransferase component
MAPEGAVSIVARRQVASAADSEAERRRLLEEFRWVLDPYVAAGHAHVDDVIDPRETRPVAIRSLELARGKIIERPWKKHGVMPVRFARLPAG